VTGARLTGAGRGGCAIAIGSEPALRYLGLRAVYDYGKRFSHRARTWMTSAAPGARIDRIEHQ
jgi:galactokinase